MISASSVKPAPRLRPHVRATSETAADSTATAEAGAARLSELTATIRQLRGQDAETSSDDDLRARWDAAVSEYETLSASLGGAYPRPGEGGDADFVFRSAPPAPPGCTASSFSFSNSTSQPIPNTNTPITSTITVSGAGPYLYDLDLQTFLPHTSGADLDVTITHGSTTVTLTTDNGFNQSNTYNGTVWDDDADPDGVPTADPNAPNDNQVQVHNYGSTLASPLTPEEALAAFVGDNPNGTWTLTVVDDNTLAGTTGRLTSWAMNVVTLPSAPTKSRPVTASSSTPVTISAGAPSVIASTITVSAPGTSIFDVNATTNITHEGSSELQFAITSPAGTTVTLSNGFFIPGAGSTNVFAGTTWDDDADPDGTLPYASNPNMAGDHPYMDNVVATPLAPVEGLGAFIGENPNGVWTLRIADQFNGGGGALNSWSLSITTASCGVGPAAGTDTVGVYVSSTQAWFLRNSNSAGNADFVFTYGGSPTPVAIDGDWDGDGDDTPGLYEPSTGAFFLKNTNSAGNADIVFTFGAGGAGYIPVVGDWNDDGIDSVGLYNPSTGVFFLKNTNAAGSADLAFQFGGGGGGLKPLAGDWNGNGTDSIGLYNPSSGAFFLKNTNAAGPADVSFTFGGGGATAIAGDWNGDGTDSIGLYVASTGTFFLKNTNAGGNADLAFAYGPTNSVPLGGDWDGA